MIYTITSPSLSKTMSTMYNKEPYVAEIDEQSYQVLRLLRITPEGPVEVSRSQFNQHKSKYAINHYTKVSDDPTSWCAAFTSYEVAALAKLRHLNQLKQNYEQHLETIRSYINSSIPPVLAETLDIYTAKYPEYFI
jgi:hypothetical protein